MKPTEKTMTNIKQEILNQVIGKFIYNGGFTKRDEAKLDTELGTELIDFLSQAIDRVERETRKENKINGIDKQDIY